MQDIDALGLLSSGMFAGATVIFSMFAFATLPLLGLVMFCKLWRACNRIAKISDNMERIVEAATADQYASRRECNNDRRRNMQSQRKYY